MRKIILLILVFSLWAIDSLAQRRLFTDDVKTEYNGYVYDFIENYFSEITQIDDPLKLDIKLHDDKVIFINGSVNDIGILTDSTDFSLTRYGDSYYEARWLNSEDEFLKIAFPIQYELLLGKPKIVIEKELESMVRKYSNSSVVDKVPFKSVEKHHDNVFRTSEKGFYQIPSLNDCIYLICNQNGDFSYLCDTLYIKESITNLFHPGSNKECTLVVEQNLYGFNVKRYNISLIQWLNYCQSNGFHIYAAIEEETTDSFKVLIIAQCLDLGFNHLLSATVPKTIFSDRSPVISVKMNAFIPTHNIKDLYQQYTVKNKKIF